MSVPTEKRETKRRRGKRERATDRDVNGRREMENDRLVCKT